MTTRSFTSSLCFERYGISSVHITSSIHGTGSLAPVAKKDAQNGLPGIHVVSTPKIVVKQVSIFATGTRGQ